MVKIEADKELTLKEMKLKAQAQASTSTTVDPPPRNRDAKSPKLPAFIDEKDELLTGRAMDVCTRMSDDDNNDYDKLKKALLTNYSFNEDGYRKRFREVKPEIEETPDQFVIRLKN